MKKAFLYIHIHNTYTCTQTHIHTQSRIQIKEVQFNSSNVYDVQTFATNVKMLLVIQNGQTHSSMPQITIPYTYYFSKDKLLSFKDQCTVDDVATPN